MLSARPPTLEELPQSHAYLAQLRQEEVHEQAQHHEQDDVAASDPHNLGGLRRGARQLLEDLPSYLVEQARILVQHGAGSPRQQGFL